MLFNKNNIDYKQIEYINLIYKFDPQSEDLAEHNRKYYYMFKIKYNSI